MSNRSHLVPTQTTTKDGIQTTVYKKPSSNSAVKTPLIPVVGTGQETRAQLTNRAVTVLTAGTKKSKQQSEKTSCRTVLAKFSDDAIREIIEAAGSDLHAALLRKITTEDPSENFIRDWIMLEPTARENDMPRADPLIYGLDQFPHMAPYSDLERRQEQGEAIVRVTNFGSSKGWAYTTSYNDRESYTSTQRVAFIADESMRTLLTTHENPRLIADIIIDRDIFDAEEVAAIADNMKGIAPSLLEGAL